ncbi:glycosyltransferase family 4 protein [Chitinophaga agrisoli]|uniref:Glycosyltransferase family 4 protein n=1 Tax=Chitinophaga agrisoli TaxID=2607653 RepID=A0A5B2VL96_9BACT|nr:glycosyltransferase family 4 protein [Chitinophaga agrisoli]KAA2239027.1 glycosyltransferase family 4 protein [Chitinophaga agrisoli]
MKFVFASYITIPDFNEPEAWLHRIRAYAGIHAALSREHEVVCVEQINYEGVHMKNGAQYHFLRLPSAQKFFPKQLHRFIKEQLPDVVVIHSLYYPLQVMQLRRYLGDKVKIIIQHHAEQPYTGLKKYLQRRADNAVDAYLFASREMGLDWIRRGNLGNPDKINEVMELSSVFYPIDKTAALTRTKAGGAPVYLWVGRLNDNKDPLNVVRAFLQFAAHQPAAKLYMIYHTTELLGEIQQLLHNHPQQHAIVLTGQVPHDALLYWYNSADYIISGSYYEGSGTAICEAMSCGCIPIVTNIPSFRMMTDHGRCGFLYEAGNEEALLQVLQQTISLDSAAKKQLCLDFFRTHLSFQAIARRMQEIAGGLVK